LKNASLPLITNVALALGFMLSGAVITEGVFSWPGLGRWIFSAIGTHDYNVLQAAFYLVALCVIIANIISDILYGLIDPRIKYGT
jgi:peptide/nickel transport system permease protein